MVIFSSMFPNRMRVGRGLKLKTKKETRDSGKAMVKVAPTAGNNRPKISSENYDTARRPKTWFQVICYFVLYCSILHFTPISQSLTHDVTGLRLLDK